LAHDVKAAFCDLTIAAGSAVRATGRPDVSRETPSDAVGQFLMIEFLVDFPWVRYKPRG
jgi:hypothetical protein